MKQKTVLLKSPAHKRHMQRQRSDTLEKPGNSKKEIVERISRIFLCDHAIGHMVVAPEMMGVCNVEISVCFRYMGLRTRLSTTEDE